MKKWLVGLGLGFGILIALGIAFWPQEIAMLHPKGWVALQERDLMVTALLLMLIVVIPVFVLTIVIAWRYRANNHKATYDPEWNHSWLLESIWWGLPVVIIAILSVIGYRSSHELDPFKPLDSQEEPLVIQVVALQWRWLFIYPAQGIATMNFLQFPEEVPLAFEITADAPMNSFWIPQLGGQVYAMPGMKTKLHLIANARGEFRGASANLSGVGFADMSFMAKASSEEEFESWVEKVKQTSQALSQETYMQLARPTQDRTSHSYVYTDRELFDWIIMKSGMTQGMTTGMAYVW